MNNNTTENTALTAETTQTRQGGVMKRIAVVNSATNQVHDLTIAAGTTTRDILKQCGFPEDYVLSSGRGQEPYGADENIYAAVADGGKLWASSAVEVGADLSRNM